MRVQVVVAHNGPAGLGGRRHCICGVDWTEPEADFGDPDLQASCLLLGIVFGGGVNQTEPEAGPQTCRWGWPGLAEHAESGVVSDAAGCRLHVFGLPEHVRATIKTANHPPHLPTLRRRHWT